MSRLACQIYHNTLVMRNGSMKSYYGNLIVDIFEFIFSVVSLLLVWLSCVKDSVVLFGITAIVYMLPRLLSVVLGISNNGRDILRLIFDITSLTTLLILFVFVCFLMFHSQIEIFPKGVKTETLYSVFYSLSAVSMFDIIYKVIVGIVQKFSLVIRNHKANSVGR